MKQFEISADAERSLNVLVDWFGARRGGHIVDAYDWVRDELRRMPELGTLEPDGRTRVLVREKLYWVYEVLPDRVVLLDILDPRRDSNR
jgi:plasmid stabilization system protein ParE